MNFGTGGELLTDRETQEKKQREIYVGNLAIGAVNASIVEEFFNQALSHLVPDPVRNPPVINVNMDGQGRFAFIELRDAQLANQAMLMDKIVENTTNNCQGVLSYQLGPCQQFGQEGFHSRDFVFLDLFGSPDFQTPALPPPDELSDPNLNTLPTHPKIKYVARSPCCDVSSGRLLPPLENTLCTHGRRIKERGLIRP